MQEEAEDDAEYWAARRKAREDAEEAEMRRREVMWRLYYASTSVESVRMQPPEDSIDYESSGYKS